MNRLLLAQEAHSLAIQFNRLPNAEPDNYGVYVEDGLARLDRLGFKLGDVIKAGICRLGRVSSSLMKTVEEKPEAISIVTTDNWREEVQEALAYRADYIAWKDRTFLEIMLIEPDVPAHLLTAIERVVVRAYEQEWLAEAEWQRGLDVQSPLPGEQLAMDV